MSKFKSINGAANKVVDSFKGLAPVAQKNILSRLKLREFSASAVKTTMANAPALAIMVALDAFGPDSEEYLEIAKEFPELIEQLGHFAPASDNVTEVAASTDRADEFRAIRAAIGFFGSEDRFLEIRRALTFGPEIFAAYKTFQKMVSDVGMSR